MESYKNCIKASKIPHTIDNYYLNNLSFYNPATSWGICGKNISKYDMNNLSKESFCRLAFDSKTIFSPNQKNIFHPEILLEKGKSFGLGLNNLHNVGLDGKGINVAIIDWNFNYNNPEMIMSNGKKKILYYDNSKSSQKSCDGYHGKTVSSLLAGNSVGVSPNSNIYYFAIDDIPSDEDKIDIFNKIIELNKEGKNIQIISMSSCLNDRSSEKKYANLLRESGVELISSNTFFDNNFTYFDRNNYLDISDYNNFEIPVFLKQKIISECPYSLENKNELLKCYTTFTKGYVHVPCGGRTTLQIEGNGYQYIATSCASYSIPQVAGLFAIAKQLDPNISFKEFSIIAKEKSSLNKIRI